MFLHTAQCETVITADQALRGGKAIDLKKTVDTAVQMSPTVKRVFVMQRTGASVPMGDKDIPLHEVGTAVFEFTELCSYLTKVI